MVQATSSSISVKLSGKLNENDTSYDRVITDPKTAAFEAPKALSDLAATTMGSMASQFKALDKSKIKEKIRQCPQFDIYSDIHPFVETAVLVGPESDSLEKRYINANRITSIYGESQSENLMIAMQGPKANTAENVWRMVMQERCTMIITLVHEIPGDCDEYFPWEAGSVNFGPIKVTFVEETQESRFFQRRDFKVEDTRTQQTLNVSHYWFTEWVDWQLPSGKSRTDLAKLVAKAASFVSENARKTGADRERLLVHCRAGIGRTGTTLTLINATIAINEQISAGVAQPLLSFFSIVRRLREQRIWMVQTDDQYYYLYEFLKTSHWLNN